MIGQMRRKDRVMEEADCAALLQRALIGRLGTADQDGQPYVTPMNFIYMPAQQAVYLHCGKHVGHMQTNLLANPKVCFEIDEPGPVIATGPYGCNTSQLFESVILFGEARLVEDDADRRHALNLFIDRYIHGLMPDRVFDPELNLFAGTAVYRIDVRVMTGKRRELPTNIQQGASVLL